MRTQFASGTASKLCKVHLCPGSMHLPEVDNASLLASTHISSEADDGWGEGEGERAGVRSMELFPLVADAWS